MNEKLREHQWRVAQEAMLATIATMRAWLDDQPPLYEYVRGERIDNTAEAKAELVEMEWRFDDLSCRVWNRFM
jgi:hypothetical protein